MDKIGAKPSDKGCGKGRFHPQRNQLIPAPAGLARRNQMAVQIIEPLRSRFTDQACLHRRFGGAGIPLVKHPAGIRQILSDQPGVVGPELGDPDPAGIIQAGQIGQPMRAFKKNAAGAGGQKSGSSFRHRNAAPDI